MALDTCLSLAKITQLLRQGLLPYSFCMLSTFCVHVKQNANLIGPLRVFEGVMMKVWQVYLHRSVQNLHGHYLQTLAI